MVIMIIITLTIIIGIITTMVTTTVRSTISMISLLLSSGISVKSLTVEFHVRLSEAVPSVKQCKLKKIK